MTTTHNKPYLTALAFTILVFGGLVAPLGAEDANNFDDKRGAGASTIPPAKDKKTDAGKTIRSLLGERHFDAAKGFSFRPPKGWQKATPDDADYVTFRSPMAPNGFYSSVTVRVEAWRASLATFVVQAMENLRQQMPSCEIKYEGSLKISGKEAYQICNTSLFRQLKSVFTIRTLQIMTVAYGHVYVISFSSLERDFDKSKKLFDLSAATFRIAPARRKERARERQEK